MLGRSDTFGCVIFRGASRINNSQILVWLFCFPTLMTMLSSKYSTFEKVQHLYSFVLIPPKNRAQITPTDCFSLQISTHRKPFAHKIIRFCESQNTTSGRHENWHNPIRILVNEILVSFQNGLSDNRSDL